MWVHASATSWQLQCFVLLHDLLVCQQLYCNLLALSLSPINPDPLIQQGMLQLREAGVLITCLNTGLCLLLLMEKADGLYWTAELLRWSVFFWHSTHEAPTFDEKAAKNSRVVIPSALMFTWYEYTKLDVLHMDSVTPSPVHFCPFPNADAM